MPTRRLFLTSLLAVPAVVVGVRLPAYTRSKLLFVQKHPAYEISVLPSFGDLPIREQLRVMRDTTDPWELAEILWPPPKPW